MGKERKITSKEVESNWEKNKTKRKKIKKHT